MDEKTDAERGGYRNYKATVAHVAFTLVGSAFLVFEILFVAMYTDKFWFGVDIRWLGIPAVLLAMLITHVALRWQESETACHLFAPIWQEKPPIVYSQWVRLNDPMFAPGIRFGNRTVMWSAVHELDLTIWGNLLIKSRSLSGTPADKSAKQSRVVRDLMQPAVVLKFPFSVASPQDQRELVETITKFQPNVVLNSRLTKALGIDDAQNLDAGGTGQTHRADPEFLRKGTVLVSQFGAIFLFVVLVDVGYSAFNYLQMLKGYYLSQVDAISGNLSKAQIEYDGAENIRLHPLPFSWVTTKLMTQEPVGPTLYQAKADALWYMGKKDAAIDAAAKALDLAPKSFRNNLRMARMLTAVGKTVEAQEQIEKANANHRATFLPALYMVALKQGQPPPIVPSAKSAYQKYRHEIDEEVFGVGPQWPPGGNRFLHDIWFKDDVEFVFDRLIGRAPD